jgi:hypothetical protein
LGPRQRPRQQSWAIYLYPTEVAPEVFAEVLADNLNTLLHILMSGRVGVKIMYESHIDSHTIAMLVVAFRSAANAAEQEAPVREGVVGETVGFPTGNRNVRLRTLHS